MKTKPIKRGDIYYADLNPVTGSEQGGVRPCLVVQNDLGNTYSPTIVIVPITCKLSKNPLPTHVTIPRSYGLETDSLALTEQIRTVDRSRISGYIGHIGGKTQLEIDKALAVCLGFENKRAAKGELLILCLCPRCENSFRNSGYIVVGKGGPEAKKSDCDFCSVGRGLIFGVFNADNL